MRLCVRREGVCARECARKSALTGREGGRRDEEEEEEEEEEGGGVFIHEQLEMVQAATPPSLPLGKLKTSYQPDLGPTKRSS